MTKILVDRSLPFGICLAVEKTNEYWEEDRQRVLFTFRVTKYETAVLIQIVIWRVWIGIGRARGLCERSKIKT